MQVLGGDLNRWNILRTREGQEQKVAILLSRKQIVSFCPVVLQKSGHSYARKTVNTPLFPSYVFVNLRPHQVSKVLHVRGVEEFLFSLGKRATVSDEIVKLLDRLIQETKILHVSKTGVDFHTQEHFQIGEGSYGNTQVSLSRDSFYVQFPTLGFCVFLELDNRALKSSLFNGYLVKEERV